MDISLNRIDYTQIATTLPRTTKLLPPTQGNKLQKVAVGDKDGVVQLFSFKKNDLQVIFKTLPGKAITNMELGGALGTVKDKIFVSAGNAVMGYTRKGKQFLGLETNLTDDIHSIHVSGSNLLVCSSFIYNHFYDCEDTNYYLSGEEITDVISLPAERINSFVPVLACRDRSLRVMKYSGVRYQVDVAGPPSTLHLFYGDGGSTAEYLLYGTTDAAIGCVALGRNEPTDKWTVEPSRDSSRAGVVCMDHFDMTGDGVRDLIVGRDDGSVQIFSYDDGEEAAPTLRYTYAGSETVTSVQGGHVSNSEYEEVLVTSYSGWLFGLSSEKRDRHAYEVEPGVISLSAEAKQRIYNLRAEVESLQERVSRERERYHQTTQSSLGGISAVPYISVNDRMTLSKEDASYLLTIEVQTPIDNVLLQSDVPVDLLDVEKNSAVVSYSTCDQSTGNFLLATYRCQANTTRLEVKIRTIEGQYGRLQAYVTPRLQPKCCQVRQYQVKPLSLHMRAHRFDPNRPYNSLTLTGKFSYAEVHAWLAFCLPEVPERPPSADSATLSFVSTFLDTMLHVNYRQGQVEFKSDNISTISIIKDVLTKEATKKKIHLSINCDVNEGSVVHTLQLLHPKLDAQLQLAKKVALIGPLTELVAHEHDSGAAFLTPEYRAILQQAAQLQEQSSRQPAHLERLYGMITDLYIDKHKFQGVNVKSKVPQLLDILYNYDLGKLLAFFTQGSRQTHTPTSAPSTPAE
ncbi:Bardet-Biedl syndrome 7 protein homolog isoform X2 [Amphibalanus amphitrite]|uniref:Bardet-Biedl syndrome 7 protein homolog isoform X2 n=1 Tax=Amphibalanus amphitrite TaxID=1232801 RepID=UPI001C900CB4|nr:Bardet-Biedl syndrome 7 protein homolog isoform X2 [Amphibalanus amphitrite]